MTEPYYNNANQLVIPSDWRGVKLRRWMKKNRLQIVTSRILSGTISDGNCYNFIEARAKESGIFDTLRQKEILYGTHTLMRVFHIISGKKSNRKFDNALADGNVQEAITLASPANTKLLSIYLKAIKEMTK